MLVNNPMGSRRRRRFYHRAGIVPGAGGRIKTGLPVIDFFRFEPELHVQVEVEENIEELEYHLIPRVNIGGKRRDNNITVSSLHTRLLEIVDSMISLAEKEDREKAKQNNSRRATDEDIGQPAAAAASAAEKRAAPDSDKTAAPGAEQATALASDQSTAPAAEQPIALDTDQPTAPAAEQPIAPAAKQSTAPAADQPTAAAAEQSAAPGAEQPAAPAADSAATKEIIKDGDGAQSSK